MCKKICRGERLEIHVFLLSFEFLSCTCTIVFELRGLHKYHWLQDLFEFFSAGDLLGPCPKLKLFYTLVPHMSEMEAFC